MTIRLTISKKDNVIREVLSAPRDKLTGHQVEDGYFVIFAAGNNPSNELPGAIFISGKDPDQLGDFSSIDFVPHPKEIGDWHAEDGKWVNKLPNMKNIVLMERVRAYRNKALAASDWTQTLDSPMTEEKRKEWASWRHSLRNIPKIWPEPPEAKNGLIKLMKLCPGDLNLLPFE